MYRWRDIGLITDGAAGDILAASASNWMSLGDADVLAGSKPIPNGGSGSSTGRPGCVGSPARSTAARTSCSRSGRTPNPLAACGAGHRTG